MCGAHAPRLTLTTKFAVLLRAANDKSQSKFNDDLPGFTVPQQPAKDGLLLALLAKGQKGSVQPMVEVFHTTNSFHSAFCRCLHERQVWTEVNGFPCCTTGVTCGSVEDSQDDIQGVRDSQPWASRLMRPMQEITGTRISFFKGSQPALIHESLHQLP